jgi:hypothetical protein
MEVLGSNICQNTILNIAIHGFSLLLRVNGAVKDKYKNKAIHVTGREGP